MQTSSQRPTHRKRTPRKHTKVPTEGGQVGKAIDTHTVPRTQHGNRDRHHRGIRSYLGQSHRNRDLADVQVFYIFRVVSHIDFRLPICQHGDMDLRVPAGKKRYSHSSSSGHGLPQHSVPPQKKRGVGGETGTHCGSQGSTAGQR